MTPEQWADLWRAIQKAVDDVRNNRAPPAAINTVSLADTLERVRASLPAVITTLRAHQGVETGVVDLLEYLAKQGVPHAHDIEAAVLAMPGVLEAAEQYLPAVLLAWQAIQPAATGIPGAWAGSRGHV